MATLGQCGNLIRMFQRTDDLRITQVRPLLPPAILLEEIPVTERASNVVANTRSAIVDVIEDKDPRLVAIVGPCSIHDTGAALEYATRLKVLADRLADDLIVVMPCTLACQIPVTVLTASTNCSAVNRRSAGPLNT